MLSLIQRNCNLMTLRNSILGIAQAVPRAQLTNILTTIDLQALDLQELNREAMDLADCDCGVTIGGTKRCGRCKRKICVVSLFHIVTFFAVKSSTSWRRQPLQIQSS